MDEMNMGTEENIDDVIIDEYDWDEMDRLDSLSRDDDFVVEEPRHANCLYKNWSWMQDISAWNDNEPEDEHLLMSTHTSDGNLYLDQMFPSKEDAVYAIQKYSILHRVEYKVKKSAPDFMILACRSGDPTCPWYVRLKQRLRVNYWRIVTYMGDHVCQRTIILDDNVHLNKKVIAKEFEMVLEERLRLIPRKIQADIEKSFGYRIPYLKAWKAQQEAYKNAFGTWVESFNHLPHWMHAMQSSDVDTQVRWVFNPMGSNTLQVERVFWAFGPAIRGFTYCRPLISIDGTHMYGRYKARLLVAITLDANNHLLPLAFALVESENNDSWSWFLRCIRDVIGERDGLCIISDRHKGILHAMNNSEWLPPRCYHRYCIRHLASNFNMKVKDTVLKKELSRIAYLADKRSFNEGYEHLIGYLRNDNPRVVEWLEGIPKEKWALSYDLHGRRWGCMTTNSSECYNNILRGARDLPICTLVRFTYKQSNEWFVKRREAYTDYESPFVPKLDGKLEELMRQCNYHR